jgi:Membrane bound beta barrel domain (DUF5777)
VQKTTKLKKMKQLNIKSRSFFGYAVSFLSVLLLAGGGVMAQTAVPDSAGAAAPVKNKPVKNTFESNWIIDNQSVMVPHKGTLEFDIQHRFGIVNHGYSDFYGLFAPSNIRLGITYVPVNNLQLGIGLCKDKMELDFNLKYAILKQTKGGIPVSLTYYGNMAIDTRSESDFINGGDRVSYFNQLMVARKFCPKFSAQAAISLSHFNNVPGYIDQDGVIRNRVKNDQLTLSLMGRYKLSNLL